MEDELLTADCADLTEGDEGNEGPAESIMIMIRSMSRGESAMKCEHLLPANHANGREWHGKLAARSASLRARLSPTD